MAIRTHREFWDRLLQLASYADVARYSPNTAYVTGFCLALRIAAQRPDFALAFEKIEEAGGIAAKGTDDVSGVVQGYLEELEIELPEAGDGRQVQD